ncbi:MAG: efflux RND transporter periplasmic adaptor subunit [Candidatus Kapabacteria bacterium]|jgi:Cu(I)/Ag(I) efflux system membrane fusion protein|nr:efflux RND transporter periplasmic adaptor subunit [Candidatus Kapabacteria bacterium]
MKYLIFAILIVLTACSQKQSGHAGHNDSTATQAAKPVKYICPMHPNVTSDKEGICPICQMDLVPENSSEAKEYAEDEHEGHSHAEHTMGELVVTGQSRVLADVQTAVVQSEPVHRTITAIGTLDFAEQNRRSITARVAGRIEKLYVNQTGMTVRKGQALFELHSPELMQTQNEFILAVKNQALASLSGGASSKIVEQMRQRLMIMGMTSEQVQKLEQTQAVQMTTTVYAPSGGTVIEKKVIEGTFVNIGTPLFDVADLSLLWNMAELYENDVAGVKIGQSVALKIQTYPNETFKGRVAFIYPVVNTESRTVKVRIETPNPHGRLRPAMYTETLFTLNSGTGLTIPDDAVLVTGKQNVVWVQAQGETNKFEARHVTTGAKFDGKVQILSGLSEGEKVVASGGFLLDSERQLRGGTGGGHNHGGGEPPQKTSGSMNGMKM